MKLWYSQASPFVRKVMVTAIHAGKTLELRDVKTTVTESDDGLRDANPLGKIPALELDDGRVLFDSSVICAWLIEDLRDSPLNPQSRDDRFAALVLESLADGIMESAVNTRYELALRPESHRWQPWIDGQMLKVRTGLDALERDWLPRLEGEVTVGVIAAACALGYLDFRFGEMGWRADRRRLADWFEDFVSSDAMKRTAPPT